MGQHTQIIELYGTPACGKTTLRNGFMEREERKDGKFKIQNFDNAVEDIKKISPIKLLSCISFKALYYACCFYF